MRDGVADELDADGGAPLLGRRLVHRADADVVDERGVDGVDLRLGVGRQADQHVRADDLPDLLDRQVFLADVHAVGAGLGGHRGTVVDDEQRADALAQRARGVGHGGQLVVGQALLAELDDVRPARHRGAQEVREAARVGRLARDRADEVEVGGP